MNSGMNRTKGIVSVLVTWCYISLTLHTNTLLPTQFIPLIFWGLYRVNNEYNTIVTPPAHSLSILTHSLLTVCPVDLLGAVCCGQGTHLPSVHGCLVPQLAEPSHAHTALHRLSAGVVLCQSCVPSWPHLVRPHHCGLCPLCVLVS